MNIEEQYFGQDVLIQCDSSPYSYETYLEAKVSYWKSEICNLKFKPNINLTDCVHQAFVDNTTRALGIDAALKKYNLQALLVPSDNFSPSTEIPAMAGYPMVTIPAGIDAWGKLIFKFMLM
jgi:hypothetical protein